jgi:hypothetical protein
MPTLQCEEYDIEMETQHGWEVVDCQPTRHEANLSRTTYEINQPGYPYRVKLVLHDDNS